MIIKCPFCGKEGIHACCGGMEFEPLPEDFSKMLDRAGNTDFIQPIPDSTLLKMKMIRQKLNEAKERLQQEGL